LKGRTCAGREEPGRLDMAMKPNGKSNSVNAPLVTSPERYLKMPFKTYREPHRADPFAVWCERRKTSSYPIRFLQVKLLVVFGRAECIRNDNVLPIKSDY
jgi:hypothetical protein